MRRDLAALEGRLHDLLVVGGGVHGAAAAWEAARRGMRVALVEAEDFASGASWNSLRTIHGGLRHLQQGNVAALRASARDRAAWMRLAPELIRPVPFLVPTTGHGPRGREAIAAAAYAAHALTLDLARSLPPERRLPAPSVLGAAAAAARVPGLDPAGLSGAVLWHEAQATSSERLVLGLLHAAAGGGAALANRARVEELLAPDGRVTGALVRDGLGGGQVTVRARATVNAAGAGLEPVLDAHGWRAAAVPWVRAWNLVLRRPVVAGGAVGARAGGRFLFLVPWRDGAAVGTGYAPPEDDPGAARRTLLREAQEAFPWARLAGEDVAMVHEGLVPGRRGADGLIPVSRVVDHAAEGAAGLWSIVAVKFTTALSCARRVVDALGAPPAAPSGALPGARLPEGSVEDRVRTAVRDEMATTLADVVLRRLDLAATGAPDAPTVDAVAAALASELGWDAARVAAEREGLAAFFAARRIG